MRRPAFNRGGARSGPVAGSRTSRPCGFSPAPAATTACPLSSGFGHRLDRVMHRRCFTAGVPLPVRAVARPCRCRPHSGAPAVPWGSTLRGLVPCARVSRRLRRSDPPAVFPPLLPTCCVRCCRRDARRSSTHCGLKTRPCADAGRGSWALSPRAVRAASAVGWTASRPMPPWALPLSGLRSPTPARHHLLSLWRACRSWDFGTFPGFGSRRGGVPRLRAGPSSVNPGPSATTSVFDA